MIPKNKIEEGARKYYMNNYCKAEETDNIGELARIFTEGVSFAEKELENLAIEFAEWIVDNLIKCPFTPDKYTWYYNNGSFCAENTQELFEMFKKEKYGTESN